MEADITLTANRNVMALQNLGMDGVRAFSKFCRDEVSYEQLN
jgi:hypothetical protein